MATTTRPGMEVVCVTYTYVCDIAHAHTLAFDYLLQEKESAKLRGV